MNKLKIKPFGWKQVSDISEVNIYDYIKNRFLLSAFFIFLNQITLSLEANKLIITNVIVSDIIFLIIYILISYQKIKTRYIMWYWIAIFIPIIDQIIILLRKINGNITILLVSYIVLCIITYYKLKNFDKDKVSVGKRPTAIMIVIVPLCYFYVMRFDYLGLITLCSFLTTFMCLYNYYEIKYVLRNNTEYKQYSRSR